MKLVCNELSADVVVLVVPVALVVDVAAEVEEPVDPPVRDEIRLCTSAANPLLELVPEIAPPESEFELALVLLELLLSDCALSAAIRLCMKFWNAVATSLDAELVDAAATVPVVVDAAVDAVVVAAVAAAAAVLAVVDEVAPIEASASKTAATRPPARGADPEPSVLEVL